MKLNQIALTSAPQVVVENEAHPVPNYRYAKNASNDDVRTHEYLDKNGISHKSTEVRCCGNWMPCNDFTNTCECGADYNWNGSRLAPRSQWEECVVPADTKEHRPLAEAESVKNYPKILKQYHDNEEENAHTENGLLLATHFGTDAEQEEGRNHLADLHKRGSGSWEGSDYNYRMSQKYYQHLRKLGGADVNESYDEMLAAHNKVKDTYKSSKTPEQWETAWNLHQNFLKMYGGKGAGGKDTNLPHHVLVGIETAKSQSANSSGYAKKVAPWRESVGPLNEEKWSAEVTAHAKHHPKKGLYATGSAEKIAKSENGREINFYLNRAGKGLSPERRATIRRALALKRKSKKK